jgi:hypothetical protein
MLAHSVRVVSGREPVAQLRHAADQRGRRRDDGDDGHGHVGPVVLLVRRRRPDVGHQLRRLEVDGDEAWNAHGHADDFGPFLVLMHASLRMAVAMSYLLVKGLWEESGVGV